MSKKYLAVLFTSRDVKNFLNQYNETSNAFLFCSDYEKYFYEKNTKIYSNLKFENKIQLKTLSEARKIKKKVDKIIKNSRIENYLIENINSVYFILFFSLYSIKISLKKFDKFYIFNDKDIIKCENINELIQKSISKFQQKKIDFYTNISVYQNNLIEIIFHKINNFILRLYNNKNFVLISGSKKVINEVVSKSNNKYFLEVKNNNDFKYYHLILNIFSIFKFGKKLFYLSTINYSNVNISEDIKIIKNLLVQISSEDDKDFYNVINKLCLDYCVNQIKIKKNIDQSLKNYKIKYAIFDQVRFGVSTILAHKYFRESKDVILAPHGSISIPNNAVTKSIGSICTKGLIVSDLATHTIAQSKISYDAIKYYDKKIKILKSKSFMYGKIDLHKNFVKKEKEITFLYASSPKFLYKWPWIHETYNEYLNNTSKLIKVFKNKKNFKLLIRFRESDECTKEDFLEIIDIKNNNNFITISNEPHFINDLKKCDYLISFSSTTIEEGLINNIPVINYSGNKNYRHVNLSNFKRNQIHFVNDKNMNVFFEGINEEKLELTDSYNIDWLEDELKESSFTEYLKNN